MSKQEKTEHKDLLIELGCEELPPKALDTLREALFSSISSALEKENIRFDATASRSWSSPRRLALFFAATATAQPDQDQERRGPAVAAAFGEDGAPTQAALGFARSAGVDIGDLETLETDKGTWLVARSHVKGKTLAELLYPILEQALKQLPIPRPMRWADHDFSFVRPVHWLVVLHGSDVLPGSLFGLQADRLSRGHRIHAPGPHSIRKAADYLEVLLSAKVLADPVLRRQKVRQLAIDQAAAVHIDENLLDEVNNLVEWPSAILCSFDEEFLAVPHRALIASMQDHQKFFPVFVAEDSERISNQFIAIANLESTDPAQVRVGFERVIRPRLADARFFLEQDQKQSLADRQSSLDAVVFQKKIGSLGDKSARIASVSKILAEDYDVYPKLAQRAGSLAKCDLMTQMVGEFPELQGYMGRHYALHSGEDPLVAAAIEEHYQPRFAGDVIPASALGQILGLSDRADTLVGIFAADLKPSGNKDPFALRRAALGLVRILTEAGLQLAPLRLLELAAAQLRGQDIAVSEELVKEVHEFVMERARSYFREAGHAADLISAAFASQWADLPDLAARLRALAGFMGEESAQSLAAANKRIGNILRKSEESVSETIDEDGFVLDEERLLFDNVLKTESALKPLLAQSDYAAGLQVLSTLRPAVDRFFDGVMVMDEDSKLRQNRLALLARLKAQFDQIADLSVLG